jgi:predicted DNA-binding transcriptional regulator AlpA
VDTYGHLIPGADIAWVDRLDSKTSPQQNATQAQLTQVESGREAVEVVEKIWLPPQGFEPRYDRRKRTEAVSDQELLKLYYIDDQLAATLGVTRRTLWRWDRAGIGPPRIVLPGRKIAYLRKSVEAWLTEREHRPVRNRRSGGAR